MPRISVREKLERARAEQERQDQALEEEGDSSDVGDTNSASDGEQQHNNATHSGQKPSKSCPGSNSSDENRFSVGCSDSDAIESASGDEETSGHTGHNEELEKHSPPTSVKKIGEDVGAQGHHANHNAAESSVQQSGTDILERSDLDSIETKYGLSPGAPEGSASKSSQWSKEEHARFLEAMHFFHRDWRRISSHVKTKTVSETRMHASK
jgi:hypothetical protein